jgi:hypothetical protein
MTCPGNGSRGTETPNWLFQNWARTKRWVVPIVFNPKNVHQVVAGVQKAESDGGTLKAMGSGWSYSDAALDGTTTHVMNTDGLNRVLNQHRVLNQPVAKPRKAVIPFALKDALQPRQRHFVHVEAGIKLWELNCALDNMRDKFNFGLAMPTLGGDKGQSLAGAISTGTHGSHVDLPPIADAVRAIHLVGPGGQEWWIEREGDKSVTDPVRMATARQGGLLCGDIVVKYEDSLFRAVLVSMGRMGVIYSYVLEVVDAFKLNRTARLSTWSAEQSTVRKIQSLAPGFPFTDPWIEIVVNPYADANGDHACVVTTCDPAGLVAEDNINPPSLDPCATQVVVPVLLALQALLPLEIAAAAAAAVTGLSFLLAIPFVGPPLFALLSAPLIAAATSTLVALDVALADVLAEAAGGTPGAGIADLCNLAAKAGHKELIPALIAPIMKFLRPENEDELGPSYRILTGQDACPRSGSPAPPDPQPLCMRQIDGAELALDLSPGKNNLFDFMSDVFALTDSFYNSNVPVGFAMSLRFSRNTTAMLGMQQFVRTCSIEFMMLRGLDGQADFLQQLFAIARRHGAIPHWGLLNQLTADEVHMLYPEMGKWRLALTEIITGGNGQAATFRSNFSLDRGLEPGTVHRLPLPARIDLFLRRQLALMRLLKPKQPG